MAKIRTYTEMCQFQTFEERYNYLKLGGIVGEATFSYDRWINQMFYTSKLWKQVRRDVIVRDGGCDLGVPGHEISFGLVVHHVNPMTSKDIEAGEDWILNPEFLVVTTHDTHNAIHYGDETKLKKPWVARQPGDTRAW